MVEKETKVRFPLEEYVLEKVRLQGKEEKERNQFLASIVNSEKFKAFEKEREGLKKMRGGTVSPRSPLGVQSKNQPEIKGLK